MSHSLAGVTIHVDDRQDSGSLEALYAVQHVLDDTADRLSYYGAASEKKTLTFVMFENLNSNSGLSTLKAAAQADANVTYTSDQGSQGSWRITGLRWARLIDAHNTQPVYECTAELIKAS